MRVFRLSAFFFTIFCASTAASAQSSTYSIDGHKFKIPKAYVLNYAGNHSSIALQAMLPDLRPRDSACAKHGTCNKMVYIVISAGRIPPVRMQLGGIFVNPAAEKRPGPFGLIEYPHTAISQGSDVYAKNLPDGQLYAIFCLKPTRSNALSFSIICSFSAPLSDGLSLRYEFQRSQLRDWEQIHTSILSLLSSFETD